MAPEPTFYAIYDADGSLMGEVRYLRDKCLGKAECALCDLSHGWSPLGRSDWRRRKGVSASLNWLHRDELPGHVAAQVAGRERDARAPLRSNAGDERVVVRS